MILQGLATTVKFGGLLKVASSELGPLKNIAHPKFNSSPLRRLWLEDDPFLLGFGNFSGASR